MESVNKTMYIPLYGKAYVSRKGIILQDEKAEMIWETEGFPLKGKSTSKWLAYMMGMRSAVFDRWLAEKMQDDSEAIVLHIGCGMDSRVERVGTQCHRWYDIDFPEVISERQKYYSETSHYSMMASDARKVEWLDVLPFGKHAIVVMEGISMYFEIPELQALLAAMASRFCEVQLLMDCYTRFGAMASKYHNPINDVGVTQVAGVDSPLVYETGTSMTHIREHALSPADLMDELPGMERLLYKWAYGGSLAKRIYRLYEYGKG